MQTALFSPPPGPSSAEAVDRQVCGQVLRPNGGARWDKRPTEPGIFKVVGRTSSGRFLCVPCNSAGAIDKDYRPDPAKTREPLPPFPVSAAWQAWLERPVPVMP